MVVRDQDLERVLYYARRIRALTLDIEIVIKSPDINLDVLFSIFNRINKAAAFHSVRTLEIFDGLESEFTYQHQLHLFPISAPTLETLTFLGG